MLRYIVAVTTGGYKDGGIDNGIVSINLIGVDGDTGVRELTGAITKNMSLWQPGQTDIFTLEAVSVGKLKKVEITCTTSTQGKTVANFKWIYELGEANGKINVLKYNFMALTNNFKDLYKSVRIM